ncbi:MAG: helix-turn-helix domain-containing protein [Azospira sp.]|nr:helix-turn-helix domain-containing protein [Azospira sp.]
MAKTPDKKASQKDWHPADILAALHKRGLTLRDVARKYGLKDSSTLSKAMITSYPASERRLAEAVGVPVQEMFPTRYYKDGTPLPRGIRGARKLKSTQSHYQSNGNERLAA